MISTTTLRNAMLVISWFAMLVILYRCQDDTVKVNGCTYHRLTEPNGTEAMWHSDTCSCTSPMNDKQFEFQ